MIAEAVVEVEAPLEAVEHPVDEEDQEEQGEEPRRSLYVESVPLVRTF